MVAGCDETILICKSGRSIVRVALIPHECCLGGVGCPQEHLPLEGMPSRVSPTCQQSVSLSHLNERSQSQGLYPPPGCLRQVIKISLDVNVITEGGTHGV